MAVGRLYEDDDYIIVNKPYDMYINSDNPNEKNTVACHIASHDSHLSSSSQPLHFVQRLDYSTSGVLCVAKTKSAASRAGRLFEQRLSRKYYLAVVRGRVPFDLADIKYAVGADLSPGQAHRMAARRGAGACGAARAAHSRALALEAGRYRGAPATVLLLKPVTGRRHQLRVHARAAGHALLGDYTYSDRADTEPHRMFLHAARLVLPLPTKTIDVQTPEPFHSDARFARDWRSERVLVPYRGGGEFRAACDVIDCSYTVGLKYEEFSYDE